MRPPDKRNPDRAAARPGLQGDSARRRVEGKSKRDPRELQGIRTARHAGQHPPTWAKPAGSDAADLLDRVMRPRTFVVVIRGGAKSGLWGRYGDRVTAERMVQRLRMHGLDAHLIEGDEA